jgi:hypothetical protein
VHTRTFPDSSVRVQMLLYIDTVIEWRSSLRSPQLYLVSVTLSSLHVIIPTFMSASVCVPLFVLSVTLKPVRLRPIVDFLIFSLAI